MPPDWYDLGIAPKEWKIYVADDINITEEVNEDGDKL